MLLKHRGVNILEIEFVVHLFVINLIAYMVLFLEYTLFSMYERMEVWSHEYRRMPVKSKK